MRKTLFSELLASVKQADELINKQAMTACVYCEGKPAGAVRRLGLWIGLACGCRPCGGHGKIPVAVHEAWVRGESGEAEWREFEEAAASRR